MSSSSGIVVRASDQVTFIAKVILLRRILRWLIFWAIRPIATPIVLRHRLWTRASVDESLSATRIQEIERNVRLFATELSDLRNPIVRIEASLGDVRSIVASSFSASKASIDEANAALSTTSAEVDSISKRLSVCQLGIDALRIDQKRENEHNAASFDLLRSRSDDLSLLLQAIQRSDLLTSQVLFGASERADEKLNQLSTLQLAHFEVSNIALSRADMLLQRTFIPLGPELLMRTEAGFLLIPADDNALIATIWETGGQLEPGTIKVLKAILKPGDRIIDIGANVGLLALPAARSVGPTGHVIAFEPASKVADLLSRTMALNGLSDRVTLHQCAVGEMGGKAFLNLGFTAGHSSLLALPGSQEREEVDVRRLDDEIQPGLPVRCIKIDAEGFEPEVWRGMQRVIADNAELVVIVEFGPTHLERANITTEDWINAFLQPGFTAYEIEEATGAISRLRPLRELQHVSSVNLLLLRQPITAFPTLEYN